MKKFLLISALLVLPASFLLAAPGTDTANYDLVPKPQNMERSSGFFIINKQVKITAPPSLKGVADLLTQELDDPRDSKAGGPDGVKGSIRLSLRENEPGLSPEGYKLDITPGSVQIVARDTAGAIHAIFTLIQLREIQRDEHKIPCLRITDNPRFAYRGMHLDVSRHFFPVSFIKRFLDMMALYKFNTFHWHLVDGAGWRLEIKKYPLLTSVAAWRPAGNFIQWWGHDRHYSHEGDPDAYGGYYTQDQAREVVAYAAKRGITVIPEIEMPAHSEEVLAVYPQLSCSGEPYQNSEFCIGNDSTFTFLEDVLTEVMAIFPSRYIHIGGDEASMKSWKTCPKDQRRMQALGLKDVSELQSYAVRRIEKFLTAHGRKLLGWDEILKGGLAPEATVMSWRGEAGGIAAARMGHDVVMTPGTYCYFDHYQTDPSNQPPAIGGYLPIDKVYSYDPVPEDSLTPSQQKHILGVQANLWTEFMPTTYIVEYRAFPRMLALSEVSWDALNNKNLDDFMRRLQSQYLLLQRRNVHYYRPSNRVQISAVPDYGKRENQISFSTEQYRPEIHYTTDGAEPTSQSPRYQGPFEVPGKTQIRAAIFKAGIAKDSAASRWVNYHHAIGKRVIYNNGGWSARYPAQAAATLTNGTFGSLTYTDGQWQGFLHDVDVTVDMNTDTVINRVAIRFMQLKGPGVFLPGSVSLSLSSDGTHFAPAGVVPNDISPADPSLLFKTFSFDLNGKKARYIRLKAPNTQKGYMFTDEIVVD